MRVVAPLQQKCIAALPGFADTLGTLVCREEIQRGPIYQTAIGEGVIWSPAKCFTTAGASICSNTIGVAIAQNRTDATDAGGEMATMIQLLTRVNLFGLLV